MKKLSSIILLMHFSAYAQVKRIKSIAFNKATVEKIFIAEGLTSIISFNCNVSDMKAGNTQQLKLESIPTNRKQVSFTLAKGSAQATNAFIWCSNKNDPFIFDVVPSRENHQDYLKINLSYGEPQHESTDFKTKSVKIKKPAKIEIKPPEKIEDSFDKIKNKKIENIRPNLKTEENKNE